MSAVRVRFPPSPTGYCHVGTARMAVVNFLFARRNKGTIVFRSEDTDKDRSKREYEDDIKDSLSWLGISWDEFHRQSERTSIYQKELHGLIESDTAYVSVEESKREPGTEVHVIRLRNPGKTVTFSDVVRGDITFDTTELGDFVIARSESDPLYHFAVVVDDGDMGITHVIRGEDHISNTPRQILIQEALGLSRPVYAHYPLHLASDRSKLSKRKGDVAVRSYREQGFLPQALLNYLATLGWTPPSGREMLALDEMISEFDITDLHKSGAVFDVEKLRWYNRQYLALLPDDKFEREAMSRLESALQGGNFDAHVAKKLVPIIKERISVWSDIAALAKQGEFDYFFKEPMMDASKIPMKKTDPSVARKHLEKIRVFLESLDENAFTESAVKDAIWNYATEEGRGDVLWPFRYALTGREKSPDPFAVASIIGKVKTIQRVNAAVTALS